MLNNTQTFINNSEGYIFLHLILKENENEILLALFNSSIIDGLSPKQLHNRILM